MVLQFWGVRGTAPVAKKPASRFGGQTPCASVTTPGGDLFIIDAGLGIHSLGTAIAARQKKGPLRVSLFLTHFHLDHLLGLPYFAPLFSPKSEITFYTAADPEEACRNLDLLVGPPFFPIPFGRTQARKTFRKIHGDGLILGGIRISTCPLNHPQGAVAYRFEGKRGSVVFATDTEPPADGLNQLLVDFAGQASLLIYDAMFTPEEYASGKQGWGHSTWLDGVQTARAAGAKRLILSHFNPGHSDREIGRIERLARKALPGTACAFEGMRLRF